MKIIKRLVVAFVLSSMMFLIISCSVVSDKPDNEKTPSTTSTPPESDQVFLNTVAKDADLNRGITMIREINIAPIGATPFKNDVGFIIMNHTNENITFPNEGFGLEIFWFDALSKQWFIEELDYSPYPRPQTLPPRLERLDFEIMNNWYIPENKLINLPHSELRFFISGVGETTGKQYGAYLDVEIIP